jgi:hypothetical protein
MKTADEKIRCLIDCFGFDELKLMQEMCNTQLALSRLNQKRNADEGSMLWKHYEEKIYQISHWEYLVRNAIEVHPENPVRHVQANTHQRG